MGLFFYTLKREDGRNNFSKLHKRPLVILSEISFVPIAELQDSKKHTIRCENGRSEPSAHRWMLKAARILETAEVLPPRVPE